MYFHTKSQVCIKMSKFILFITAVCVLFLIDCLLPWRGPSFFSRDTLISRFCDFEKIAKFAKLKCRENFMYIVIR